MTFRRSIHCGLVPKRCSRRADRAAALTQQLLAFSRRQVMRSCVMNVNTTVEHTEKMLRRLIGEDIELVLSLVGGHRAISRRTRTISSRRSSIWRLNARDCDAEGRPHHRGNSQYIRWMRPTRRRTHLGVKPGEFVMVAVSDTGQWHGCRDAPAPLRAVFHHQGKGQRHGPGAGHRVWRG